jgi:DNA polymerase-3 subunit delta
MTFFFYGPNTYALKQQLGQMIAAYKAKTGSDIGLERVDGSTVKARELVAILQASPFLATSRLVIVDGMASNKTMGEKLADMLTAVPSSTVAVFVEREVDQRTNLFKALSRADKVVKFDQLSAPQLSSWAKAEVARLGAAIDAPALRELVDLTGGDQWRLAGEVGKLVNYSQVITLETVRKLVAPSINQSVFDLVEAMTAGRTDAALASYRGLLAAKENELYILTMVQWQLRNLLLAKTAPGLTQAELAKTAGMSPYVAGKMMSAQRHHAEATLTNAYRAAADCELDIKSGRLKPEAAVEQLVFRVATASGASRS